MVSVVVLGVILATAFTLPFLLDEQRQPSRQVHSASKDHNKTEKPPVPKSIAATFFWKSLLVNRLLKPRIS